MRNVFAKEGTLVILFGLIAVAASPLLGIFAWFLWHGQSMPTLTQLASLFTP